MRVVSVVGARPQFVKAGVLSRRLRTRHREILVHTGQHYDHEMSEVFFEELGIPPPDHNLGVGSGSHGGQTGLMLERIEKVLLAEQPQVVIVYGDTNSTLAGALAAAKLHIPVAHVEAGLRSFNRRMPEEINRVLTDQLSDLLFCPSEVAKTNLAAEGITSGVHIVGDIMVDAIYTFGERARSRTGLLDRLGILPHRYFLATVHRAENTDDPSRLRAILEAFTRLPLPVVFPVHPRTKSRLRDLAGAAPDGVIQVEPVGYLDMLMLQSHAVAVLTDSGGMQKEAYCLGTPCVTLREATEWIETVEAGWNRVCGVDPVRILAAMADLPDRALPRPPLYGDGHSADKMIAVLEAHFASDPKDVELVEAE
jgi:UDP-GlcNAc3NAcA epimerase